jgi:hypothetical protein
MSQPWSRSRQSLTIQGIHSDCRKRRLKRPAVVIKRRITASIFTVYRRNPSSQVTNRVFRKKTVIISQTILYPLLQ